MRLDQPTRALLLSEFVSAFFLGMRYFVKPKPTLNYPFEKSQLSPAFAASMRCGAIPRRGAMHRLQAVRSDLSGVAITIEAGPRQNDGTRPRPALRHRHAQMHLLRLCARSPARSMPSWRGRISNSRPRCAEELYYDKAKLLATATAGSARLQRISRWTHPTGRRGASFFVSSASASAPAPRTAQSPRSSAPCR